MDDQKLEIALAEVYIMGEGTFVKEDYRSAIAVLCDYRLDKSGALLNRVRALAEKLRKERKIQEIRNNIAALAAPQEGADHE